MVGNNDNTAEKLFIRDIQQQKAADTFRNENSSFLWVQNIWVTDSPLKHPIELNWDTFNTTHEYLKEQPNAYNIGQAGYDNLTAKLTKEKNAPNGFFILVILTAGSSLLMQIVMNKSQKAQMELQTVDGQGAQTQKIMTWMMPIMMAVFAFMYTAAFSIYIVLSSALSMLLTYLINLIVDRQYKKEVESGGDQKIRGRVYTPKEEEKKKEPEKKEKKNKDDKFAHQSGGDFLTGPKKTHGIKYKK
jgi:membrane protein insertase Oxa1/YidC/SpoIIIJ